MGCKGGRERSVCVFGKAPKCDLRSWVLSRAKDDPARLAAEKCDSDAFVRLLAEKYFSITTSAIRKHDPQPPIIVFGAPAGENLVEFVKHIRALIPRQ